MYSTEDRIVKAVRDNLEGAEVLCWARVYPTLSDEYMVAWRTPEQTGTHSIELNEEGGVCRFGEYFLHGTQGAKRAVAITSLKQRATKINKVPVTDRDLHYPINNGVLPEGLR